MTIQDELRVEATIENVRRISEFVRDMGRRLRLTEDTLFDIDLAVEEASANIVRHAYRVSKNHLEISGGNHIEQSKGAFGNQGAVGSSGTGGGAGCDCGRMRK